MLMNEMMKNNFGIRVIDDDGCDIWQKVYQRKRPRRVNLCQRKKFKRENFDREKIRLFRDLQTRNNWGYAFYYCSADELAMKSSRGYAENDLCVRWKGTFRFVPLRASTLHLHSPFLICEAMLYMKKQ